MKKEYSNEFLMIPVTDLPDTITEPYAEFDKLHSDLDITLDVEPEDDNGNIYYSAKTDASFEDVDDAMVEKYGNYREVVVLFKEISTETMLQFGTSEFPARVKWANRKGAKVLNISGFLLELP